MPGLDQAVLDELEVNGALERVRIDVLSDMILAPHYAAVFEHAGLELWEQVRQRLRSGTFSPALPILEEVPKETGVTRPAAILTPADRLLYQILVDFLAPIAEDQLDRDRVFSHVLACDDSHVGMFEDSHQSWQQLQQKVSNYCESDTFSVAIRADVSAFFERIYQHNLVNLLHSCGCDSRVVNLLEKLFSSWAQKNSHGIPQGMFPSDFLGTFSLCTVDADLEIKGIPSARYVDDIYMFFEDPSLARRGFTSLVKALRNEGLNLNERKTAILDTERLLFEETELDRMFDGVSEQLAGLAWDSGLYGFSSAWRADDGDDELEAAQDHDTQDGDETDANEVLQAVEALYELVDAPGVPTNRIERFCLPLLGSGGSPVAVNRAVEGLRSRPHLAQTYGSYLVRIGQLDSEVGESLESLLTQETFAYDWQLMWIFGVLAGTEGATALSVRTALGVAENLRTSVALRAIATQVVAKHGSAVRRRALRNLYGDEPSDYVRSAILFGSRYFPAGERRTCVSAWAGHGDVNVLVAQAISRLSS